MNATDINDRVVSLLLEAFPDETIQYGQRLRKRQVEALNTAIIVAKYPGIKAKCTRCQGSGEIVTDWARYLRPLPDDVGDEAVERCPDCEGEGS